MNSISLANDFTMFAASGRLLIDTVIADQAINYLVVGVI